jgi:hypothetical protein
MPQTNPERITLSGTLPDSDHGGGAGMRLLSRFVTWWKAVSRSDRLNAEMEAELALHIESYAQSEDLQHAPDPRNCSRMV